MQKISAGTAADIGFCVTMHQICKKPAGKLHGISCRQQQKQLRLRDTFLAGTAAGDLLTIDVPIAQTAEDSQGQIQKKNVSV